MPADRIKRIALIACILGSGIVFLDGTVVNVALPAIRRSLGGGLAAQQWAVETYLLTLSSLLLVGGSLGDLFGRRRVFRAGLVGFGVCSLLCALAPSAGLLIGARAVQGMAGALLVPSALALIMDTFQEHERAAAIGTWTAWAGMATVIGPLGGGALIQVASWRWVFAINLVPVAITLLLLRRLGDDQPAGGHVDFLGAVLVAFGLGGPVFALIEQPRYGWGATEVAAPLLGGIALLVAFFAWERRAAEPMLPLSLFGSRSFSVGNLTTLAVYAALGAAMFLIVLFIQQVAGYSPIDAGLSLLPITLLIFALSKRFGALADRVGPRAFMASGPVVAGGGLLLLTRVGPGADYVTAVLPGIVVFGLGMSATVAPLTAAVLGGVDLAHSGVASAVNNAVARVASLLAIAVVGAVVAASFQARVRGDLAGRPLSTPARSVVARAGTRPLVVSTPGVTASERPVLRAALVDASVHSFRVAMLICRRLFMQEVR